MRLLLPCFSFVFLSLLPICAYSADYYWDVSSYTGSTLDAACKSWANASYPTHVSINTTYSGSSTGSTCVAKVPYNETLFDYMTAYAVRTGGSCPEGATFNSSTGSCDIPEPDQCEPTIGQRIKHEHNYGNFGSPPTDPPVTVCEGVCQYSNTFENKKCYRNFLADKDAGYCSMDYLGNGVQCTGGDVSNPASVFDQPPTKPPIDKTPEYNQDNKCGNWVTGADGIARRECTATNEFRQPGDLKCENTNGNLNCSAGTPPPEYTKTDITATTDKTTNPDGSTKTETTTTKDTTVCKGNKPCTSDSSETKDTSGTNPDGSEGDNSSECVGTACGKPDPKPGMGDEEGEEEEEPVSAVTGGATCDAPPTCEGDAVQCAILNQQFEARCDFEESADFDGSKTDIEGLFDGDQFELETSDIQAPSFINSGARFLPASCPPPQQISLTSNGGHTYSLKFDPLCSFASDFSYLILAMMSIWCAVYVGRAFGGE